ncbi:MAG: heme-binding protein [Hydrogenophaga sp.]|nr:heme-binding protein [Hydrogenophaga sp.]
MVISLWTLASAAAAQTATFASRSLTPELALQAAQAALERCRAQGFQVAVAVVDRSGTKQVFLRDRFAGPHTVEVASDKAWSALSFRTSTLELAGLTQPGQPMSGLLGVSRMLAVGGGLMIEGGGSIFGGIGVSGGPSGEADDGCAQAGLHAIAEEIQF